MRARRPRGRYAWSAGGFGMRGMSGVSPRRGRGPAPERGVTEVPMPTTFEAPAESGTDEPSPSVDVVVPVYNEAHVLAASIGRLHEYLAGRFPFPYRITIADNASTDATWTVAQDLARRHGHVRAVRLDQKGRGRALK